jgi:hypothetical protein
MTNDLATKGTVVTADNSNPPKISRQVVIAMHGRREVRLAFIVDENGAINLYTDGSQGNTIGAITTVGQPQVRQICANMLRAIGRA